MFIEEEAAISEAAKSEDINVINGLLLLVNSHIMFNVLCSCSLFMVTKWKLYCSTG